MSKNFLIIDANSMGHFYNNAKPLSIGELPVQAIYGFLRGLRQQLALYQNYQPIVLWDGASWRKLMFPSYKEIRERSETKNEIKLKEMKDTYKKQVPYIKQALSLLGIPQLSALNMEADDLGAILTDKYAPMGGKIVLLTGDKDWLQLVSSNVMWRDFINNRLINSVNMNKEGTMTVFEEMTGVKTIKEFIEVKALAGDTGDSVPGVGGIGQKGAVDFLKEYGSFNEFVHRCVLEKTIDVAKLPKKYRALIEDEDKALAFNRNLELVDLRTKARPAPINLTLNKGEPNAEKFNRFCELLLFKSITQEFDDWIRVFPAFRESHALAA